MAWPRLLRKSDRSSFTWNTEHALAPRTERALMHTEARADLAFGALRGYPMPLASDRPLLAGFEAKSCRTSEVKRRINGDDGLHLGSTFRDLRIHESAGLVIPYFIPSMGATVGNGQRRSATEAPGSEAVRGGQGRSEAALKRLLIRRFWVRNPGGAPRKTRKDAAKALALVTEVGDGHRLLARATSN